jgi:FMN phosphatase YigB (HAD superfamily)
MRLECGRMDAERPPSLRSPQVEYLVLDAGGVIVPSAMPQVVADLAARSGRDEDQLWRFFNAHLHEAFWSGRIGLEEFWTAMTGYADVPGIPAPWHAEAPFPVLTPLAHIAAIRAWASRVPTGLLSNQRAEWLLPALARAGLLDVLDPILISSQTGRVKPAPSALAQLTVLGVPPETVLYVDDRAPARKAARALGVTTVDVDPAGTWIRDVAARIAIGR